MKRYQVVIKVWAGGRFKYAVPLTCDTWAEANERAKAIRASGIYESVKIRKVEETPTRLDQTT